MFWFIDLVFSFRNDLSNVLCPKMVVSAFAGLVLLASVCNKILVGVLEGKVKVLVLFE